MYFTNHSFKKPIADDGGEDEKELWDLSRDPGDNHTLLRYGRPLYEWRATLDLLAAMVAGDSTSNTAEEITPEENYDENTPGENTIEENDNLSNEEVSNFTNTDDLLNEVETAFASTDDFYATMRLIYSGSRWFAVLSFVLNGTDILLSDEYHAFWE